MKKFILPAILVSLGSGAAFAGNANSVKAKALTAGYRIVNVGPNETVCVNAQQQCDNVESDEICTWNVDGVTQLHSPDNPTMCGSFLYKIPETK